MKSILFIGSIMCISFGSVASDMPSSDTQIKVAEMALPTPFKARETVMGYIGSNDEDMQVLREGDNGYTCRIDAADRGENKDMISAWFMPASVGPMMRRLDALREEGVEGKAIGDILKAEVVSGALEMPKVSVGFAYRDGAGTYGNDMDKIIATGNNWQVIFAPFKTWEDLSLPTKAEGTMPWVMAEGSPFAHIMVFGKPSDD